MDGKGIEKRGEDEHKCVILLHATEENAKQALNSNCRSGKKTRFAYLGEDFTRLNSIVRTAGENAEQINICDILQGTARKLRQHYVDYIGGMSSKNCGKNQLYWWAGRISEKNPYVSKAFLHSCYLKVAEKLINEREPGSCLVFLIENEAVGKQLAKNTGLKYSRGLLSSIAAWASDSASFAVHRLWFLFWNSYFIVVSGYQRNFKRLLSEAAGSGKKITLLHIFVNEGSFPGDGTFRQNYFGKLPEHLKKKGKTVVFMPRVLSAGSYGKITSGMARSDELFLVPHAYLSFNDVLSVFMSTLASSIDTKNAPLFSGMDISLLLEDDLRDDMKKGRFGSDLLYNKMFARIKRAGIMIDEMIYTYENHTWEKVLVASCRQYYPETFLISYQHSTISQMYLNLLFSKAELHLVPLPDRLITSGTYDEQFFISNGYPKGMLSCGGAVRYEYLLDGIGKNPDSKEGDGKIAEKGRGASESPIVLITASISEFESAELIMKSYEAFKDADRLKVLVKCHPFMPFEKVNAKLKINLPQNFEISKEPISKLMKHADALVYMSSTTSVEALAAGVPAIHLSSELLLDLDQLDGFPDAVPTAKNPGELRMKTEEILCMGAKEIDSKRKRWAGIVRSLFRKVDEQVYELFHKPE